MLSSTEEVCNRFLNFSSFQIEKKQKMREATAEEWAQIVQQANVEQLEQCSTSIDDLVDDQTEEQAKIELKTETKSKAYEC